MRSDYYVVTPNPAGGRTCVRISFVRAGVPGPDYIRATFFTYRATILVDLQLRPNLEKILEKGPKFQKH
jgi:hypothetical protein